MVKEYEHTRASCSLFDVSHFGNILVFGHKRNEFLERVTVADMKELEMFHSVPSLLTSHEGGIIDRVTITNMGDFQ